jgi:hypothetical protein
MPVPLVLHRICTSLVSFSIFQGCWLLAVFDKDQQQQHFKFAILRPGTNDDYTFDLPSNMIINSYSCVVVISPPLCNAISWLSSASKQRYSALLAARAFSIGDSLGSCTQTYDIKLHHKQCNLSPLATTKNKSQTASWRRYCGENRYCGKYIFYSQQYDRYEIRMPAFLTAELPRP